MRLLSALLAFETSVGIVIDLWCIYTLLRSDNKLNTGFPLNQITIIKLETLNEAWEDQDQVTLVCIWRNGH